MVRMLASCAEGRGFDHQPGQTKDIKIGICCFSACMNYGVRAKIGRPRVRIMCVGVLLRSVDFVS